MPGPPRKPGKRSRSWRCRHEADHRLREQERKRKVLEAKIAALRAEFEVESEELHLMAEDERKRQAILAKDRLEMARLRKGKHSRRPAKHSKRKRERRVR